MTPFLHPCESCARHIRAGESACPFCGAAVSESAAASARRDGNFARPLSRAALLFASATAAVGCSSSSSTGTITDAAVESGPVALYGPAPIYDSGVQDSGGGGLPLYGPAVQDSGSGLPDDGGILAAYGPAPTKDSG
jgi:hypothetical protein